MLNNALLCIYSFYLVRMRTFDVWVLDSSAFEISLPSCCLVFHLFPDRPCELTMEEAPLCSALLFNLELIK